MHRSDPYYVKTILVQHYFAALDKKRFMQDLPVLTDMHVSTLARMLNVLQLLVFDLCEPLQILCIILSAYLCNRTLLSKVNTDYSD